MEESEKTSLWCQRYRAFNASDSSEDYSSTESLSDEKADHETTQTKDKKTQSPAESGTPRSKQRILERKKRYSSQLSKESKRAQTAKKMKRFLKRLKKYNYMMTNILEESAIVDKHLKKVSSLMIDQKQLVATDIIKVHKTTRAAGTCAYCHKVCDRLSREHLLPRSAGGRAIIRVCFLCNFKRRDLGNFGPFLLYIHTYPDHWAAALASTSNVSKTTSWLRRWDL